MTPYVVNVKSTVKILSIFVAFLGNTNFKEYLSPNQTKSDIDTYVGQIRPKIFFFGGGGHENLT